MEYDVRFKDQIDIDILHDMIEDGGANYRGYAEEATEGPHKYAEAFKRNIEYIFSSKYTVEESIEIIPTEDLELLFDEGLLASIMKSQEKGLINKN